MRIGALIILTCCLPLLACDEGGSSSDPVADAGTGSGGSRSGGLDEGVIGGQGGAGGSDLVADAVLADLGAVQPDLGAGGSRPPDPDLGPPGPPGGRAGRFTSVQIPSDAAESLAMGCDLESPSGGSGIRALIDLILSGGLNGLVQPSPAGDIPVVLLLRATTWVDQGVDELGAVAMDLHRGRQATPGSQEAFLIDPDRVGSFPVTPVHPGGGLVSEPSNVLVDLDAQVPMELYLQHAVLRGTLRKADPGFAFDGAITGYWGLEDMLGYVEELQLACGDAAVICDALQAFLAGSAEDLLAFLIGMAGGLDTEFIDGLPVPCAGGNCTAISVCLGVQLGPVQITGEVP